MRVRLKVSAIFVLVLPLLCLSGVYAADEFESVRCGSDIRKALLGRKMSDERVVVSEAKHKDIGLKHLGADIISDNSNLIFWLICGTEYVVFEEKNIVRDLVEMPKHSKDWPEFSGTCQLNGKDLPGYAIGVLKNEDGAQMLSAMFAWSIDEKQKKFVPLQTAGLRCSRDGIITADGGR